MRTNVLRMILTVFESLPVDEQSYILALTWGHQYDEQVVEHALDISRIYWHVGE